MRRSHKTQIVGFDPHLFHHLCVKNVGSIPAAVIRIVQIGKTPRLERSRIKPYPRQKFNENEIQCQALFPLVGGRDLYFLKVGVLMIQIESTEVHGWAAAIRGMRNPLNSWEKSDSGLREEFDETGTGAYFYHVGDADRALMMQLVRAGSDHSKFMRMIDVTCDITAPLYWWKEFDTYKVGTVRNSCSTMHTIHKKPFEINDFSHDRLKYNLAQALLLQTIDILNEYRKHYLRDQNKDFWYQMIQLLPSSYNQRATVQMNYAVLRNMYHARKNHKLDEWHTFCEWVESLPESELIIEGA